METFTQLIAKEQSEELQKPWSQNLWGEKKILQFIL